MSFAAEPSPPTQTEKCPKQTSKVTILDYGTEPRQQLRFTPVVGDKQTIKLKIMMGTNTSEDQQSRSNDFNYNIEITVDTTVKKIESNGDIHLSYIYSGITASMSNSNTSARDISSNLAQVIASGATLIIAPQGNVKKTYDYIFPEKVSPELKQIMMNESLNYFNQFSSPLPSQAVGVGAKWKINQIIPMMYILSKPNQTIIYELKVKERQDNVLNLGITLEQQIDTQEYKNSSNNSTSVQITTTTTQGNGQATINLNQMLPIISTAFLESKTIMETRLSKMNEVRLNHYNWSLKITIESQ
ncbi:hypothetical protein [Chroococcus sp. FPU101]|uniref:hypothetical protein n=1 Tax=Chroococcus sp. FPU101 TaxID=1974212 RepID=UPI001A8E5D43|nr:hypothetical protein [Chroococcus sp. FPU101]